MSTTSFVRFFIPYTPNDPFLSPWKRTLLHSLRILFPLDPFSHPGPLCHTLTRHLLLRPVLQALSLDIEVGCLRSPQSRVPLLHGATSLDCWGVCTTSGETKEGRYQENGKGRFITVGRIIPVDLQGIRGGRTLSGFNSLDDNNSWTGVMVFLE